MKTKDLQRGMEVVIEGRRKGTLRSMTVDSSVIGNIHSIQFDNPRGGVLEVGSVAAFRITQADGQSVERTPEEEDLRKRLPAKRW